MSETIMTCMHAQPLEDGTMQCAWVPLRVLLASPGLETVPGETMLHRVPLTQVPRQGKACLPAGRDRG